MAWGRVRLSGAAPARCDARAQNARTATRCEAAHARAIQLQIKIFFILYTVAHICTSFCIIQRAKRLKTSVNLQKVKRSGKLPEVHFNTFVRCASRGAADRPGYTLGRPSGARQTATTRLEHLRGGSLHTAHKMRTTALLPKARSSSKVWYA